MKFYCSTFDGNPQEWTLNERFEHEAGIGAEAALVALCKLNQGEQEGYVGPQMFFRNDDMFVLVSRWTLGRATWPLVIFLHKKRMTEKALLEVLEENNVVIDENEDEEDE